MRCHFDVMCVGPQLAAKLRCPERIATDADAIYVANMDADGGVVGKIAK